MNFRIVSLSLIAVSAFALAGCESKRGVDQGADLSGTGALPGGNGGSDQVNMDNGGGGIPPANRIADPNNVDYSTLAADTIYFGFDSSYIPPAERAKLTAVQSWMQANPGRKLFLAGHTDIRGTAEYNLALGDRRASSVREYLATLQVDPNSMVTNSYGANRPAVEGDSEAAYARNRRVEIGVVPQ